MTLVTTQRFRFTSPQDVGLFAHMYPISAVAVRSMNVYKLAVAIHSPNSHRLFAPLGFVPSYHAASRPYISVKYATYKQQEALQKASSVVPLGTTQRSSLAYPP